MLQQPRHNGVSLHISADVGMNSLTPRRRGASAPVSEVTLTGISRPLNVCASALGLFPSVPAANPKQPVM